MEIDNVDHVAATLAAAIIAKTPSSSAPTPQQAVDVFKTIRVALISTAVPKTR